MNFETHSPRMRLRLLMTAHEMESFDLIRETGLSQSLVKKLLCGRRTPGPRAQEKIENFFDRRIWSTPQEWRKRQRKLKTKKR